jgi:hypothetical protein
MKREYKIKELVCKEVLVGGWKLENWMNHSFENGDEITDGRMANARRSHDDELIG